MFQIVLSYIQQQGYCQFAGVIIRLWQALNLFILIMNRIEELIHRALNVQNNNTQLRAQAESQLFQLFQQNITQFFFTTANIVGDQQKNVNSRQSTASVMKTLLSRKDQSFKWYWDYVIPDVKHKIKDALLSTLISNDTSIMKAGANAIAQIAAIEIPRSEWVEIVITLAQNASHEDYNIRRASITTLGYICQELKNTKSDINNAACQQILGSLLLGLSVNNSDLIDISLQALSDSIQFLKHILDNNIFCNKTLEILIGFLNNDPSHNGKVYEVLFEFGKYCYHLLEPYAFQFVRFTQIHIQQRSQNSIYALELWDTIGTEYIQRRLDIRERVNEDNYKLVNILQLVYNEILQEVMGCILILTIKDKDFIQLRESAVKTLGTFVECGDREMVDKVTVGVGKIIQSNNPGQKQASALLFSCLCQYEDKRYIEDCFTNGFYHLYLLLSDSESIVRKNTLNGFVTLSDQFKQVFMRNPSIKDIFNHLMTFGKDKDEDTRILSMTILGNITQILKDYPDPIARQPDMFLRELINIFMNNLQAGDKQSNQKTIIVIMNLVMNIQKKQVITQLIQFLTDQYYIYRQENIQDKAIVIQHILTIIHTCLLALSKFVSSVQVKDKVFKLLQDHFNVFGLEVEGINMISAIAMCFKRQFKGKIQYFWAFLVTALDQIDQKPLFKAAISCISDIARQYQNEFVQKISQVFRRLLQFMYEPNIGRQMKMEILKCFGDLILGLKKYGQNFVDKLLIITGNCFDAVYQFLQIQNQRQYVEQLKQSLIEMYHCLAFAVSDQNHPNPKMASHFPIMSTFVVKTCDVKCKPTVDYLRSCLELIYDSSLLYSSNEYNRPMINQVLDSKQINNLLVILKKHQDREDVRQLLAFIEIKIRSRKR